MDSQRLEAVAGRCGDAGEIARVGAALGLVRLDDAGVTEGHALATQLLGSGVAPLDQFKSIAASRGALLLGFREAGALTGLMMGFPVNAEGLHQLEDGSFDTLKLDPSLLCWHGEAPAAFYAWGFVASTKEGGRAVVKATAAIRQTLFWATPIFVRAVTADGLRALTSLGFVPHRKSQERFLYLPPLAPSSAR